LLRAILVQFSESLNALLEVQVDRRFDSIANSNPRHVNEESVKLGLHFLLVRLHHRLPLSLKKGARD